MARWIRVWDCEFQEAVWSGQLDLWTALGQFLRSAGMSRPDIDEVIAFRTYDSLCEREGRPFWTPHSAFVDPNAPEAARPRESLEMRVLCLFGV